MPDYYNDIEHNLMHSCPCALNSTHVLLISGFSQDGLLENNRKRVSLYDFPKQTWSTFPELPPETTKILGCSAKVIFNKFYEQVIVTSIDGDLHSGEILTFNLQRDSKWTQIFHHSLYDYYSKIF